MIVVEMFVWIDHFNGARTPQVDRLDELLGERLNAIGDLILAELLQGFAADGLLHDHELLHDDRDFDLLAKHLGLRTVPV